MTFEEWWTPRKPRLWEYIGGDVPTLAAKAAWNYQQERIKKKRDVLWYLTVIALCSIMIHYGITNGVWG
jgi:hypothetical protein